MITIYYVLYNIMINLVNLFWTLVIKQKTKVNISTKHYTDNIPNPHMYGAIDHVNVIYLSVKWNIDKPYVKPNVHQVWT